jgi:hypothetical protein
VGLIILMSRAIRSTESIKFRANRNTLGTVTVSEDLKNLFQPDGLTPCETQVISHDPPSSECDETSGQLFR